MHFLSFWQQKHGMNKRKYKVQDIKANKKSKKHNPDDNESIASTDEEFAEQNRFVFNVLKLK